MSEGLINPASALTRVLLKSGGQVYDYYCMSILSHYIENILIKRCTTAPLASLCN